MKNRITLGQLNKDEALRYLGYGSSKPDEKMLVKLSECEKLVLSTARTQVIYRAFDISCAAGDKTGDGVAVKGTNLVLPGKSIKEHLQGCEKAVLFAATISSDIDRLIRLAQLEDMAKAVIIDSLSSVAIEQVCDEAEKLIKKEFNDYYQTFRFGVGYGDLPISLQKDFVRLLEAPKYIGLNVTSSYMLTPTKSVTAVIGLSKTELKAKSRGCQTCNMRENCKYRLKGGHCNG